MLHGVVAVVDIVMVVGVVGGMQVIVPLVLLTGDVTHPLGTRVTILLDAD